jgi:three-Cys-motif partner protein
MPQPGPYAGREQTQAKHFILKGYLQGLAFKVLTFSDLTFVDGFCGPWQTKTEDFSDSSFMIAIKVLKDAQSIIFEREGKLRYIRLFFSEIDPDAFRQLTAAIAPFNDPANRFEIRTFPGKFEDAVDQINTFIGSSLPLIFIDPTGWSGYPIKKIKPLFFRSKCEVLINFMYEFINRFVYSEDPKTIASLDLILGGPGWQQRLDKNLPVGAAAHELFKESLKEAGRFRFVVSTAIDKAFADRPHFFITYATKSLDGLKEFRATEYRALREYAKNRANAKEKKRDEESGSLGLFPGHEAGLQAESIDEAVKAQMAAASAHLIDSLLKQSSITFQSVVMRLLQRHMLRETNVKDICAALAKNGTIERTWGAGNRKPKDSDIIKLKSVPPPRP